MGFFFKPVDGNSGGSISGETSIDDTTISTDRTWSSAKIEDFVLTNDDVVWSTVQGENLSIDYTKEGYLREVEIWGNTIQNEEDLSDIQHLGELYVDEEGQPILDGEGREQYKIEIESRNFYNEEELLTITPKTHKTTLLLPCQLMKVGDVADRLYWDNEKGKYVVEKKVFEEFIPKDFNNITSTNADSSINLKYVILSNALNNNYSFPVNINNLSNNTGNPFQSANSCIGLWQKDVRVRLDDNKETTVEEVVNKLLELNGLRIYVKNPEPQLIETNITKEIFLSCYKDKTHLFVTGGIDGTIKAKIPLDGGQAIQSLSVMNLALNEEVSTLSLENEELKQMDNELVATSWDMDFRMCEIEWTLEDLGIGQEISTMSLENNIIKNTKGSVSNMALTRFEQAKIMIIGGVYNKETLTKQLTTYLNRGYLTQEEYDELIALMEAKDLVVEE